MCIIFSKKNNNNNKISSTLIVSIFVLTKQKKFKVLGLTHQIDKDLKV